MKEDAAKEDSEPKQGSGCQRPIEDILQALDQLVLSAPREVEISIDWGAPGAVNIREKTVLPSDASGDRSEISETDGLPDDRRRDIETLLKEVDECLKLHKGQCFRFSVPSKWTKNVSAECIFFGRLGD